MAPGRSPGESSVVVPGVDIPSTVACIRSLGSAGIHTIVASERRSTSARWSSYCDEFVVVPSPNEDVVAYKDALLEVAAREDVRAIVPVREEDVYVLARYRDAFEPHVSLLTPPMDILTRVQDRIQLVEAADAAGVPVPETRLLGEVEDWSPPLLVKSRYNLLADAYVDGLAPGAVRSVKTIEHLLPGEEPDTDALREAMHHEPIVQEYVTPEDEYMVAALYDHGEPLAVFQHRQVRGTDYRGSGGAYRESVTIPELDSVARDLLDHLDWHGLACLEYMKDAETGEFKLAEINPRMWQSLSATVRMGADFPLYYWLAATGRTDAIDPGYDVGVGCHWLKGELLYALSLVRYDSPHVDRPGVLSTLRDIASSCVAQPHFDYLTLDDPGPFVRDWLDLLDSIPLTPWRGHLGASPGRTDGSDESDRPDREPATPEFRSPDEFERASP